MKATTYRFKELLGQYCINYNKTCEAGDRMPAVVGFVNIVSNGSGGVVQFGDTAEVAPSSNSKTFAGAGSFLTGSIANSNTGLNATNTLDSDLIDNFEPEIL